MNLKVQYMYSVILLTFASLAASDAADEYSVYMQKHWTCSRCGQSLIVSVAERLEHEQTCDQSVQQKAGKYNIKKGTFRRQ